MSRLIAFGCSLTYGDCIKDCINYDQVVTIVDKKPVYGCGSEPSQYAWPSVLGKLLNVEQVVNKGQSGCSNKFIWKSIVDFEYQKDDLVFINWTFIDRYTSFRLDERETTNASIHIGPWMEDKTSEHYYKSIYSDIDSLYDFYIRSDHARKHLDSQGIKNFHTRISNSTIRAISEAPTWWNVDFLKSSIDELKELYPLALDNRHPGPAAHKHFAMDIYSEIKRVVRYG